MTRTIGADAFTEAVRHHQAGALDQAERHYRAVLERAPNHHDALRLLGVLRHQQGDSAAGRTLIEQAVAAAPGDAKVYGNLALVLDAMGDKAGALRALDRAVALNPRGEETLLSHGNLLMELGRPSDALASYRRALALNPRNTETQLALGHTLLHVGDAAAALPHIDAVLASRPFDATALSYKAIALAETGDAAAIARLHDLDRCIRPGAIGPAPGGMSLSAFNAGLAKHIAAHPTLRQVGSTHNGLDTDQTLLDDDNPFIKTLRAFILTRVDEYGRHLPGDPAHPLVAGRPRRFTIESWGVMMWSQGFQVPHVHKKAWISGVYYIQLPEVVRVGGTDHSGWIEFGRGPDELYRHGRPPSRRIQPVEGTILVFPSYLWHRTIPFESDTRRICISFDVVPGPD